MGCSFFEVSARENQGVYESFVSFAGDILNDTVSIARSCKMVHMYNPKP